MKTPIQHDQDDPDTKIKLLPCPFCGDEATLCHNKERAMCEKQGCGIYCADMPIELWNTRISPTNKVPTCECGADRDRLDAVRLAALHEIAHDCAPANEKYVTSTIQKAHRILATGQPDGILKTATENNDTPRKD